MTTPQVAPTSHFNPRKLLSNRHTTLSKFVNSVQPPKFLQRSTSRHQSGNLTGATVTPEDALWFSRLPEKIQRGQFSIEEQKLLTPRKEDVILDAADEKFYKLGEKLGNRSLPSLESSYTGPSTVESIDLDDCSSIFSEDYAMESESLLDSFRWLDTDLDLSLDDYHVHLVDTQDKKANIHGALRKQKSFAGTSLKTARSSSFASRKSIEHWGSGWAPTEVPPLPRTFSTSRATRKPSSSQEDPFPATREHHASAPATAEKWGSGWAPNPTMATTSHDDAVPATNAGPTHYLNPEARLKLKLYLASPSKFDEALEFGFPSLASPPAGRPSTSSRRPSIATARSVRVHKPPKQKDYSGSPTFLDDSTTTTASVEPSNPDLTRRLDLSSSKSGVSTPVAHDQVSSLETPVNFSLDSFQPSSLSTSQPHDQQHDQSDPHTQVRQLDREPYLRAWPGREMTLRMTLTRPELRTNDSIIYPTQPETTPRIPNVLKRSISVKEKLGGGGYTDNDLLKLEELKIGDEAATMGIGKEKSTGFRRFLGRK